MTAMKVAVLYGGVSSEREVSLRSGRAVAEALREVGHDVVALDIATEEAEECRGLEADVVFPALHGRFGEDGGVQRVLEREGLPYVGSDPEASAVAFDKMASKCHFASHGVPTPKYRAVAATMPWGEIVEAVWAVGLPAMVKPARQGSSLGVTRAKTAEEAAEGLAKAFVFGRQALVERYVKGRELTVGVLGEEALPIIEMRTRQEFFDEFAKYEDQSTQYIPNPDLPPGVGEAVRNAALLAHQCLGCRGLSRVDIMLGQDDAPQVLEVNAIPGFTSRSLYPLAARTAGIEFPALCERLCRNALEFSAVRAASV